MAGNLPDDVSPSDIDDAFGGPDDEEVIVHGTIEVAVEAEALRSDSDQDKLQALLDAADRGEIIQAVDGEVVEEERA